MSIWDQFDKSIDTKALADSIGKGSRRKREYKDPPPDTYEVAVTKLEQKVSSNKRPMVSCWMKILEGQYKGSYLFMNQVIEEDWQFESLYKFLEPLISEAYNPPEIVFASYSQFAELLMDIMECIDGNFEYAVKYSKSKSGFSLFDVLEVYPLED